MELKKKKLDYNPYEDDEFDEYGNVSATLNNPIYGIHALCSTNPKRY